MGFRIPLSFIPETGFWFGFRGFTFPLHELTRLSCVVCIVCIIVYVHRAIGSRSLQLWRVATRGCELSGAGDRGAVIQEYMHAIPQI